MKKINIISWLEQTRDIIVKNNIHLSDDLRESLSIRFSDLIEKTLSNSEDEILIKIVDDGNDTILKMNTYIDESRLKGIISIEEFLQIIYLEKSTTSQHKEILGLFNTLLSIRRYDKVIEYLDQIDVNLLKDKGIAFTIGLGTNPISPLLRRIPSNENIKEYSTKRYEILTRLNIKCNKPEDYDKIVGRFDNLYIGGAPKENN